jgi:hypothetical protein
MMHLDMVIGYPARVMDLDMVILPGGAFRHGYSARGMHLDLVILPGGCI